MRIMIAYFINRGATLTYLNHKVKVGLPTLFFFMDVYSLYIEPEEQN